MSWIRHLKKWAVYIINMQLVKGEDAKVEGDADKKKKKAKKAKKADEPVAPVVEKVAEVEKAPVEKADI